MSDFEVLQGSKVPIKMWTKGVPVEEGAKQQLRNMADMPFIFKHIAVMPDVHVGIGATVGSVIASVGAIVPGSVGVDIGCFVGETKVPLLDGTQSSLKDLTERKEPFWVYSVSKDLKVVPGKAVALKTRTDARLVRITVSGGEEIVCTPDHEFMMINGTYRQAIELKFNDSLMPLYRRWETRDGYENVSNGKGASVLTHKMVWRYFNGTIFGGQVVHHDNHVHFDNRPENLKLMTAGDHSAHHRLVGHKFDNSDKSFQRKRLQGIKERFDDPAERAKAIEVGTANITRYMTERPEHFAEAVSGNGRRGAPYLAKFNTTPRACDICGEVLSNPAAHFWHKKKQHASNHKVIKVERLERTADVYCLQVEEHHNFALAAGVFVHNCGMGAVKTSLKGGDLPDDLKKVRAQIERDVPVGQNDFTGKDLPKLQGKLWEPQHKKLKDLFEKHPKIESRKEPMNQMGTLGGGNHFIELCLDEEDSVWIMLHSGSRGIGNRIGSYFIDLAREDMRKYFINLPDKDLAYLVEGTEHFDDYVAGVEWAQNYALENRKCILDQVVKALQRTLPPFTLTEEAVYCHHNYVSRENHFGQNVLLTRKGAVNARQGVMGIIPGSMGTRSYIVRGKGNPESFNSCSHGAGRTMSRGSAKSKLTVDDHLKATEGVECRKDEGVLDESPGAYKKIEDVMEAQQSLVEVVHTLKQVLCVKG